MKRGVVGGIKNGFLGLMRWGGVDGDGDGELF